MTGWFVAAAVLAWCGGYLAGRYRGMDEGLTAGIAATLEVLDVDPDDLEGAMGEGFIDRQRRAARDRLQ